jgi:hypothetical protein
MTSETNSGQILRIAMLPLRKIEDGKPVQGEQGLIYAQGAWNDGYQILNAKTAATLSPGDRVSVDLCNGRDNVRTVAWVGKPQAMIEDRVADDEDGSMSGEKVVGGVKVAVCKVYLQPEARVG